jgi:hypothetical protein
VRRFGEDFYVKLDDMANFHYENSQERLWFQDYKSLLQCPIPMPFRQ